MSQFNRIANVTILSDEGVSDLKIQVSKLRVEFTIKKTETSESNSCLVNIYNLSESTRNKINKTDDLLTVEVGYEEGTGLEVIFIGNITDVNHRFERPNIITSLDVNDGEKTLQNSKVALSYGGTTTVKQTLKDVIKSFNIGQKVNFDLVSFKDKILSNGFSYAGLSKTVMDKLTKAVGLNWSIQNNELKIYEEDKTDQFTVINLSSTTGLIGSPEKIKIKSGKKSKSKIELDGWKVTSLLQPKIEPGGRITIKSKMIPDGSIFRVLNVEHVGDTHGGRWQTISQAVEIEQ